MDSRETERLLERALSGDRPGQVFRAKALLDSTAALAQPRPVAGVWRRAALCAAAVLVASISFLLGRCSVGPLRYPPVAGPAGVTEGGSVVVSEEVVAWVRAAQTFRQLGMPDRMSRAVERASRLLPADAAVADKQALRMLAAAGRAVEEVEEYREPTSVPGSSIQNVQQILAQALGD